MTNSIDRVYVCESDTLNASLFSIDESHADEFMRLQFLKQPTKRVFTEEKPWITDRAPDSKRTVIALYGGQATGRRWQIFAFFGSEGQWCAEDHNGRITCLENGFVVGWRERPDVPESIQLGLVAATGWR